MHGFLLHNGAIRKTSDVLLTPGQVGFLNGWGVFSTIRVTDGVLFAFERHFARLQRDAALMRVPFEFQPAGLEAALLRLVEANRAFNATLRVACVRNKGGLFEGPQISRDTDLIAFTADLNHWGKGVRLTYVAHGRHAASPFAGTKVTSWAQNLTWYDKAHEDGFDEVILLNEHGQVSECTSANIFILEGGRVWTPPLKSSGCLPGVTRAILLEDLRVSGFTIAEKELAPSELEVSDQVFITSTTRDLLPVLEVDGVLLRQSPQGLHRLQDAFLAFRADYVSQEVNTR